MRCEHCGACVPPGQRVCPVCRTPLEDPPELPLTTMECVVTMLLGLLPIVGTIILCLWAFDKHQSHARRSLSRAVLLFQAGGLMLLVSLVLRVALVMYTSSSMWEDYDYYLWDQDTESWDTEFPGWDDPMEGWEPWMDEWVVPEPGPGASPIHAGVPQKNSCEKQLWKEIRNEKAFESVTGICSGTGGRCLRQGRAF